MTGMVTLAAAAVASVGMGAYEVSQQGGAQGQALGLAETTQQEQMYYNNMLQQLIANPSSVSSLPGFEFQLQSGSQAVASQMAAGGLAGSGNEAAALTEFGQGLASSFYGQQTQLLASLSGVTNASSPSQSISAGTGAGALSTSTISSLLNSLGFYGALGSKAGFFGSAAGTPGAAAGASGGLIGGGAGDLAGAGAFGVP